MISPASISQDAAIPVRQPEGPKAAGYSMRSRLAECSLAH